MRTFAQKQNQPQKQVSSSFARSNTEILGLNHHANPLLHLQRTVGNQAVQRMLQTNDEELEVGSTSTAASRFAHDFSRIPLHSKASVSLQAKLTVNTPGDIYEQEADRVSKQVMRMPEPLLQRTCACGGECPKCQTEQPGQEHERVQTKRVGSSDLGRTAVPSIVHEVLRSPGQPIDLATRAFMEPRFGHDFSHVRVHADERAEDSARAVNALAYTVGRHLVFGVGRYSPTTAPGRRLLAHELAHSLQQGSAANLQLVGDSNSALQREEDSDGPTTVPQGSPEEITVRIKYSGHEGDGLRNSLWDLADKNVNTYITYRDAISKSTAIEKRVALNTVLLSKLKDTLDYLSFARCAELLGRKAPTFDELRKNSVVAEAIKDAWNASDVGVHDLVTQAHEEGGWVFMNLIDGTLSIERAKAEGTNFIRVEPPPEVENSVLVAIFHTHPTLGRTAKPSRYDLANDKRRGVPNLVAANTGTDPKVFQIYLSGPPVRKHLASRNKIPGSSGGDAPY